MREKNDNTMFLAVVVNVFIIKQMKTLKFPLLLLSTISVSLLASQFALAAGYEKSLMWSAKWTGLAGAASAGAEGAPALFFNPAGLAKGKRHEISLNLSPARGEFSGPLATHYEKLQAEKNVTPVFSLLGNYKLNEDTAVGGGIYTAGGTRINFGSVSYAGADSDYDTLKPEVRTDLKFIEAAIGFSHNLNSEWSLGASLRALYITGEIFSATDLRTALVAVQVTDLKAKHFAGVRTGVQYTARSKKWGAGLSARTSVDFKLKGKSKGQYELAAGLSKTPLTGGGDITLENSLPTQINIGHFYRFKRSTLYTEYSWTDYSQNNEMVNEGTALMLLTTNVITNTVQKWRDQHGIRIGHEFHLNEKSDIRMGYAFTSRVTSTKHARATSSTPGNAHSLALGYGHKLGPKTQLDLAFDYSFAKGKDAFTTTGVQGNYSSTGLGLHGSLNLYF